MRIRFDQSAPYEVEESDVTFARVAGQDVLARVYRPKGMPETLLAALVDVHGGAWSRGDRQVGVHHYALGRQEDPTFEESAVRLAASSVGYFADEAVMAAASVTGVIDGGRARALPPAWMAQPEMDDNVPAAITDALVRAYETAGGRIERVRFPGAKHGFIGQASADTTKCIADMGDFIGRQLARKPYPLCASAS